MMDLLQEFAEWGINYGDKSADITQVIMDKGPVIGEDDYYWSRLIEIEDGIFAPNPVAPYPSHICFIPRENDIIKPSLAEVSINGIRCFMTWIGKGCMDAFETLSREVLDILALSGSILWTATVLSFVFLPHTFAFIFLGLASIINLILLIGWPLYNDH